MAVSGRMVRWGILGVAKINERLLPGFSKAAHGTSIRPPILMVGICPFFAAA